MVCVFLKIRQKSNKHGLNHLQSILLSEILGEKKIKLASVQQGIPMIKHRLQQKKVLLILDDVDKHQQLHDIVGRPDWFGPGSRIIITTHGVKRTYEVKGSYGKDALQLFTWKETEKVDPTY